MMKMKCILVVAASAAIGVFPCQVSAGERGAPCPGVQAQIGMVVEDFLICVRDQRGEGAPWPLAAQACLGGSSRGERSPAQAARSNRLRD